jgi:hypothetical protein
MKKYSSLGEKTNFSKYCPGDLYLVETNKIDYINEEINNSIDMNDLTAKVINFLIYLFQYHLKNWRTR